MVGEGIGFERLSNALALQLAAIRSSHDSHRAPVGITYWPCSVVTRRGELFDRVYLVAADEWIYLWGYWPDRRSIIRLEDIIEIHESRFRLPASLANALYSTGETTIAGYEFTLLLRDDRRIGCQMGGAIDFPPLPAGVIGRDVVTVEPGLDRAEVVLSEPGHMFAFFEKQPDEPRAPSFSLEIADVDDAPTPEDERRGHLKDPADAGVLALAAELRRLRDSDEDDRLRDASLRRLLVRYEPGVRLALEAASWVYAGGHAEGYLARHADLEPMEGNSVSLAVQALDRAKGISRTDGGPTDFGPKNFSSAQIDALIRALDFSKYVVDTSFLPSAGLHNPE